MGKGWLLVAIGIALAALTWYVGTTLGFDGGEPDPEDWSVKAIDGAGMHDTAVFLVTPLVDVALVGFLLSPLGLAGLLLFVVGVFQVRSASANTVSFQVNK